MNVFSFPFFFCISDLMMYTSLCFLLLQVCTAAMVSPIRITHISNYLQSGNMSKDHCSWRLDKFCLFNSNQTEPIATITLHIHAASSWNQNSDVIRIIIKRGVFTLKEVAWLPSRKIIFSLDFYVLLFSLPLIWSKGGISVSVMSGDKWTKTLRMKQIQVKNIELLEQAKWG